jgi:hypothetical protein
VIRPLAGFAPLVGAVLYAVATGSASVLNASDEAEGLLEGRTDQHVPVLPPLQPATPDALPEMLPQSPGTDLEAAPPVRPRWPPPDDDQFESGTQWQRVEPSSAEDCELRELRGWLRVRCTLERPSVELLGGSSDGLFLRVEGSPVALTATATMPLLPGDRRVLQFNAVSSAYGGSTPLVTVFSECWVGTAGPHLALAKPDAFF